MVTSDSGSTREKPPTFELYKLAVQRNKELHDDIWNGLRFFSAIQVALLSVVGALVADVGRSTGRAAFLLLLLTFGAASAVLGASVLRSHREYYLDSQRVKLLLEDQLGLTEGETIDGVQHSLAIPWKAVGETRRALLAWGVEDDDFRDLPSANYFPKGRIIRKLWLAYLSFIAFDVIAAAIVIVAAVVAH